MVLCEIWHNLVELIEGARPAVNEHERQDLLILTVWWSHVDEVHIQSCIEAKKENSMCTDSWPNIQIITLKQSC